MASRGKSYTPPKGRATATRTADGARPSRIPPTLEWVLVGIGIIGLVAAAWFFTSAGDGSPHGGLPVDDAPAVHPVG